MASLTETAFISRKLIKWSVIGLIISVVLRILFFAAIDFYRLTFPPPALVPNNAFGRLPKIVFPLTATPSGQLNFTIQTISGTIPEASDAARVYFMPKNKPNLLSLSRAQSLVANIGFTTTPRQVNNSNLYHWIDLRNPLRTIDLDIVNGQFYLKYAYVHDLSLFNQTNIPSPVQAVNEVLVFLQKFGIKLVDLDFANAKVTYLRLAGNTLEPTTSQSQANAVRVDIFRQPYDSFPVFTDKPDEANVNFILSGAIDPNKNIIEANYNYWEVDSKTVGIYKLKTAKSAFAELQAGQAYFASLPSDNNIIITDVFLAYYDSKAPQFFLQPIYVFRGENNFMAYVPAVSPPWTE